MRLTIALAFLLSTASVLPAQSKDDGFSGKWTLDEKSPRPGDAPDSLKTRIKQDGSGLVIESTFNEPKDGVVPLVYLGVMTNRLQLSTNGQPQQAQIGPFQAAFKTTLDGHKMLTDWTAEIRGDQVHGHWTRTLSDDGRRMTLEIQESSTKGQHAEAMLYFRRM